MRRISSGIGVEKSYFLHSPNVVKVDVLKRGKVRRNYLTYLRQRQGKATRLTDKAFDRDKANMQTEVKAEVGKPEGDKPADKAKAKEQPSTSKSSGKVSGGQAEKAQPESAEKPKTASKTEDKKAKAEAFRQKQLEKTQK